MTNLQVTELFEATTDIYNTIEEIMAETSKWNFSFLLSWYDNM